MAEPPRCTATSRPSVAAGFTLIEMMVVIFIVALLVQLVAVNMGALVPGSLLDTEAKKFMASYDYLRSEAKIQGKPYRIKLDLTRNRWRVVLPPEDRLTSTQVQPEEIPLEWTPLDESVRYLSYTASGGQAIRQGDVDIQIDENGNAADQTLSFRLKEDEQKVWTVRIRGLTGISVLIKSETGKESFFDSVNEAYF